MNHCNYQAGLHSLRKISSKSTKTLSTWSRGARGWDMRKYTLKAGMDRNIDFLEDGRVTET